MVRRFLPPLQRWARGRLPARARDLTDTDDLVQVTFLRALDKVKGFELRGDGAFLAYLRRILHNLIRDHVRRSGRKPQTETLSDAITDTGSSPLEQAIGDERKALELVGDGDGKRELEQSLERFRAALDETVAAETGVIR